MKMAIDMKKHGLIKEANRLLDIIESELHYVVETVKEKKTKKAA